MRERIGNQLFTISNARSVPLENPSIPAMALAGFVLHLPAPWVLVAMLAENLFKDTLAFRRFLTRRWIRTLARPAGEVMRELAETLAAWAKGVVGLRSAR